MINNFKEQLAILEKLIEDGKEFDIIELLTRLHSADIADLIESLEEKKKKRLFALLEIEKASDVISELDEVSREQILGDISQDRLTQIVDDMESDDAADLIAELPQKQAEMVLTHIQKEDSQEVKKLLKYADDTAGGIMQTELAAVNMGLTIKEAIDRVRGLTRNVETIHNIFVVDNENRLVGILPLDKFILAGPDEMVANIMDKAEICATTNIDQEEVANIFKKYNLVTLPVVDEARRLMGRITIDDVVDVIEEEASEDIMRMAGMDAEELIYESKALKASKLRVPWLLTNLLGGLATGYLLWLFKVTLKDVLALVTFIPVITGMGGNVGIQSSSLMVRGLATGHVDLLNLKKILLKEFKVGVILGTICGSGAGITALLWHKNPMIGIVVGVSMITAMTVAASMGTLIPAFFKLIKVDPAIASGPFVTTANDITGILIYLGTATLFLKFFYNFHA